MGLQGLDVGLLSFCGRPLKDSDCQPVAAAEERQMQAVSGLVEFYLDGQGGGDGVGGRPMRLVIIS